MPLTRRHFLAGITALPVLSSPLAAAPTPYRLDTSGSRVGFTYVLSGNAQTGTMPVSAANITVNPRNLASSQVDVTLDVANVRTGFIFATQALTGGEMLDAARYPTIRFRSTRVRLAPDGRLSGGAKITGDLTVRNVTRPVTLDAGLFRAPGSAPDDLSQLTVQLKGAISRSAFGADGFRDLVADQVGLDVTAAIRQA